MKTLKSIFNGLNIFAVLFACVLISACSNGLSGVGEGKKEGASNGKAYISAVSLGNGERAIVPTGSFDLKGDDIYKYVLSARPAGGTQDLELGHWVRTEDEDGDPVSAYYAMENDLREGTIQLGTGAYIFTIQVYVLPDGITYEADDADDAGDAEEAEETSVDSQAILVLEKTTDPVSIVSGSNKIRFGTLNEASGNGTLSLTVKFPDEGVQSVTVDLTPQDEGNTHSVSNKSLAISDVSGGYRSVVFDDNPSNGWYIVKFNFTINNGVRDTNQVWSELVQIATGRQTQDEIVIDSLNTLYPIVYNFRCSEQKVKIKGGGNTFPMSYSPYQGAIGIPELESRNGAVFDGWYSARDNRRITEIPSGSKDTQTLYAKWKYDFEIGKLYAGGAKVIVEQDLNSTNTYAYFDEVDSTVDGDGNYIPGDNVVRNDGGDPLIITNWKIYGFKKDGTYPEGSVDNITVNSGCVNEIYSKNTNGSVTVNGGIVTYIESSGVGGSVTVNGGSILGKADSHTAIYNAASDEATVEITGGEINGDVTGLFDGNTQVKVRGKPVIGNQRDIGINLSKAKNCKVIAGNLNNAVNEAITLILHPLADEDTVFATFEGAPALSRCFAIINSNRKQVVKVDGDNIKMEVGLSLPAKLNPVEGKPNTFTLDAGNITAAGTIFSVFAEDGYFTLTKTKIADNVHFDMGIPLNAEFKEDGYDDDKTVSTSKNYRYIQFTSDSGKISTKAADDFLISIEFHKINNKPIKIRINLEQLALQGHDPDGLDYKLNDDVFYLDGSFYKKVEFDPGTKEWPVAYKEAKEMKLNGLNGYLMTITTDAENKFVYDRIFKKEQDDGKTPDDFGSWIGGTRQTSKEGYDDSKWTKKTGDIDYTQYWVWACGPEAGEIFYENAIYRDNDETKGKKFSGKVKDSAGNEKTVNGMNYRKEGMYSSWSNPVDCALNGITWFYDGTKPANESNKQADYEPNNQASNNHSISNPSVTKPYEYYTTYTGRYVWNDAKPAANGTQARWKAHYYIVEFTPYESRTTGERYVPRAPRLHAEQTYE